MLLESVLFFESVEEIYRRIFQRHRPRTLLPEIEIRFRSYANANSRVLLANGRLAVSLPDLLQNAPAPVHEALAEILISKLFRRVPEKAYLHRYRRYLNRAEMRQQLHRIRQERGRKEIGHPAGAVYDLQPIFEKLNFEYFNGLMAMPQLGWSLRKSRSILGHYDPSHHAIVLSKSLDCRTVPELLVEYVMFHEMLHLRHPAEHRNVRRCVHTKAFKDAERQFSQWQEARKLIREFVRTTQS